MRPARAALFVLERAPTPLVAASIAAIDIAEAGDDLRAKLTSNAQRFRAGMQAAGFSLLPGEHPIITVMLGEAKLAQDMAAALYDEGSMSPAFSFRWCARKARIRTQMSAAHAPEDIDAAIAAFTRLARAWG